MYQGYDEMTQSLINAKKRNQPSFEDEVGISQLDQRRAQRNQDMAGGNLAGQGIGGVAGTLLGGPMGGMVGAQAGGLAGSAAGANWNENSFVDGLKNKELMQYGGAALGPIGMMIQLLQNKDQAVKAIKDPVGQAKVGLGKAGETGKKLLGKVGF